jgi:hypothetical protein
MTEKQITKRQMAGALVLGGIMTGLGYLIGIASNLDFLSSLCVGLLLGIVWPSVLFWIIR